MGKTEDMAMARQSIIEELDATNKYQSRLNLQIDPELKKVLQHNMDEEKEHIVMLLEWLRKNDPVQNLKFEKHD